MATIPQVAPGDLITADLINAITATLAGLESRVKVVEDKTTVPPPPSDAQRAAWDAAKNAAHDKILATKPKPQDLVEIAKDLIDQGVPADEAFNTLSGAGVLFTDILNVQQQISKANVG